MDEELDLTEPSSELGRNQLQKVTMEVLYAVLTYISMGEEVDVKDIISNIFEEDYEDCPFFTKAVTIMAIKEYGNIIKVYNEHMNRWTFDRLNRVEQAILLLAYVHFFYVEPDVDKSVVIDVAIKLAKSYLDMSFDKVKNKEKGDYQFVNAILDKVLVRK